MLEFQLRTGWYHRLSSQRLHHWFQFPSGFYLWSPQSFLFPIFAHSFRQSLFLTSPKVLCPWLGHFHGISILTAKICRQRQRDIPYQSKMASKRKKHWQIRNVNGFAWCPFRNRNKSILERTSKVFSSEGSLHPGHCQPNLFTSYLSATIELLGQSSANIRWALLYESG